MIRVRQILILVSIHLLFACVPTQSIEKPNKNLSSNFKKVEDIEEGLSLLDDEVRQIEGSTFQKGFRITPLINSASITLLKQEQSNTAKVQFRKVGSADWQPGFPLQWEPVNKILSGSLVYLLQNTEYEVKITLKENDKRSSRLFTFRTRPNSPPVDPEKIIYLKDIYSGGTIDLEALKLEGTESGWVKIVGRGVEITGDDLDAALVLKNMRYVVLEDISINGAKRFGIEIADSHDIWINRCEIRHFGRKPTLQRHGKGYESELTEHPINYDAGIKIYRSGRIVVEHCKIHSPNIHANNWSTGHPNGASAMLVHGNHKEEDKRGQFIIRNNRFFGTDTTRFNDVIEGISNFRRHGAFTRDSAIHDNYFAYANDDVIELDGGQHNVLLYRNELAHAYSGISVAPNMHGPSYIFHNYIHSLGDDRGKYWAAIKMGGLFEAPAGKTLVFENKIDLGNSNGNGIATGGVRGDVAYWTNTQNNVFVHRQAIENNFGHGIYDIEKYSINKFINDSFVNTVKDEPHWYGGFEATNLRPRTIFDAQEALELSDAEPFEIISIQRAFVLPNFSRVKRCEAVEQESKTKKLTLSNQRCDIVIGLGASVD